MDINRIDPSSVYTVRKLNAYIKNMFRQDDGLKKTIYVQGEVSNCSGADGDRHIYFTLKDATGIVSCVMFQSDRQGLSFELKDGQQVTVGGKVDVYEKSGKYQLYAKQILLSGAGLLYERLEMLKRELEAQGMFAEEHKRPIPKYIRTLGVVTAAKGEAIRDIIQISKSRNHHVRIILYPAVVQGNEAAPSIVKGIRALERLGVDVMIVGRGGGSIEDLWAFNAREIAQAVYDCRVPIISAVGHEGDTTIIDLVADKRVSTPSAAAELAVWDDSEVFQRLSGYGDALTHRMNRLLRQYREVVRGYERQFQAFSPENRLRSYRQRKESLEQALAQRMHSILARRQERLRGYAGRMRLLDLSGKIRNCMQYQIRLSGELTGRMERVLAVKRSEMALYAERLKGLSPLERLSGGFAYLEDAEGKPVRSVAQASPGDDLRIRMRDGTLKAKVTDVENNDGVEEMFRSMADTVR